MIRSALAFLACVAIQAIPARFQEALAVGDFPAAWALLEAAPAGIETSLARTELLVKAGDPARALEAASAGLALDPGHLELLYHATYCAVWLQDPRSSAELSQRLMRAVEERLSSASPEERAAWQESGQDLAEKSRALAIRVRTKDRVLFRLRAVSIGGLVVLLGIVGLLTCRASRSSTAS